MEKTAEKPKNPSNKVKGSRILALILIILGIGLWLAMIPIALDNREEEDAFFESNELQYETFEIEVDPGVKLSVLRISPVNIKDAPAQSVPAIIHMNGANNRKDGRLEYTLNLARLGISVFVVEIRGHGESGGHFTLYAEEPKDISKIMDYITKTFPEINSTHFGVSGFSLGGGVMLLAQAIEPRVYCSVLYHPVTDIGDLLGDYGFDNLLGKKFIEYPSYAPEGLDIWQARSAYYWCNAANSENLLILQGDQDDTIFVEGSPKIINQINPPPTTNPNVQLVVRVGLGHGGNERDPGSLAHSMAWFDHFFFNSSVNLSQVGVEAQYRNIVTYPFDTENAGFEAYFVAGVLCASIGIFLGVFVPLIKPKFQRQRDLDHAYVEKVPVKITFLWQSGALLAAGLIMGLSMGLSDPNLLFGIVVGLPVLSLGLLLIVQMVLAKKYAVANNIRIKDDLLEPAIKTIVIIIPILIGVLIHDWAADYGLSRPYAPWKSGIWFYPFLVVAITSWGAVGLSKFDHHQWIYWIGLTGVSIMSVALYLIWNPVPALDIIPGLSVVLCVVVGLIFLLGGILGRILRVIYTKPLVAAIHIGMIVAVIVMNRFMNIF